MHKKFFSSDWHLQHKNVIKFDSRPFGSIDEMDAAILSNLVEQLSKGDDFYYLGDFCFTGSKNTTEGYLKTLSYTGANLFFIKGNHDNSDMVKLYQKYGVYLGEQKRIKVPDLDAPNGLQDIVLNHYSMRTWDKMHHKSWHLYGHSHNNLEHLPHGKSMDCGVVSAYHLLGQYKAFSYEDIKSILDKREMILLDHHSSEK